MCERMNSKKNYFIFLNMFQCIKLTNDDK